MTSELINCTRDRVVTRLADQFNGTLHIPHWLERSLRDFDVSLLESKYCLVRRSDRRRLESSVPRPMNTDMNSDQPASSMIPRLLLANDGRIDIKIDRDAHPERYGYQEVQTHRSLTPNKVHIDLKARDYFHVYELIKLDKEPFRSFVPRNLTTHVSRAVARVFVDVFATLWSSPPISVLQEYERIVDLAFNNSLNYTAVHKRFMEGSKTSYLSISMCRVYLFTSVLIFHLISAGECPQIYRRTTNITDFSPDEVPFTQDLFSHFDEHSYPLCNMTAAFVQATQVLRY